MQTKFVVPLLLALGSMLLTQSAVQAHFPWLVREPDGKLSYYFGEDVTDRTYKLPASMAKAKFTLLLAGKSPAAVPMHAVEQENFVGLQSESSTSENALIFTQATYGIHRGTRLEYYALHLGGKLPTDRQAYKSMSTGLDLNVELVDSEGGVDCFVSWMGKPLKDVEVHLYCSEGHEEGMNTTDAEGKVTFTDKQVEPGLNALMLGHKIAEAGKLDDKPFESQSHYLTITFTDPEDVQNVKPSEDTLGSLPALPVEVTSFGAVRQGDCLYVFGGHTGSAHSYNNEAQNDKLLMLDLKQPEMGWQQLAKGPRLQGLGMVAFGDKLILVGGFTAMNQADQEQDLRSQSSVTAFDLKTQQWSELPSLPEPRSSHDAAIIDGKIYVAGGWNMQGKGSTTWHETAWVMDLKAEQPEWVEIAKPTFVRRAVAAVAHDDKLFVIGGMNQKGGPTRDVSCYDPATQSWTEIAPVHGEKAMAGFGVAGWSINNKLVVTTYEGSIQRWDDQAGQWQVLGQTKDARFFHRMLPLTADTLVSIGGANMEVGKYADPEIVNVAAAK